MTRTHSYSTRRSRRYPYPNEADPSYFTERLLDGITAESYLADPAADGVKEGASVTLRSELEYMGQTDPTEGTAPTDMTGDGTGSPETPAPAETGDDGFLVTPDA